MKDLFDFKTVELTDEGGMPSLRILDQTLLPGEIRYLTLNTPESIYEAIYKLRVRGAPAIGVAAGYGLYVLACRTFNGEKAEDLMKKTDDLAAYLISSRPTAVNLAWAVNRVKSAAVRCGGNGKAVLATMRSEAEEIHREDVEMCRKIGENGLEVLKPGMGVLTHCNAGALATTGIGTALAPIYTANARGYGLKVFADETRPLLQGARLTSWELSQAGADVTLICDNMASTVMRQGKVQAVITGADRIAANGDTANKIGTSGVAILAKEYGIPFYVAAPYSTIDESCRTGVDIKIEERPGEEIYKAWYEKPMAPEGVKTFNPAFDVTDHKYITGIITESGIRYL